MSLPTTYTVINLQNDAVSWAKSVNDALTKTDPNQVRQAWTDVARQIRMLIPFLIALIVF